MRKEVVMFSRSLPFHGLGGMEVVAWDLSKELARQGYAVRVITTSVPGKRGEFISDDVVVVPLNNVAPARYSRSWWRETRNYFARKCLHSTYAVISVSAGAYSILSLRSRMQGVPFIMQAHGTSWGEVISKWQSRRLFSMLSSVRNLAWFSHDMRVYRRFDAVVGVGERVYKDLSSFPVNRFLAKEKIRLINNGIDARLFSFSAESRKAVRERLGIKKQQPVILSASRLHRQKGVAHGIRAFTLFLNDHPDALYLVAGDGPEKKQLDSLAEQLGVADRVMFLGPLDRRILAEHMSAADVFLFLTERVEGLPLNVLESLACGLPGVISAHLKLFQSDAIHDVSPQDYVGVSKILNKALARMPESRKSLLSEVYELEYAVKQYLALLTVIHGKLAQNS